MSFLEVNKINSFYGRFHILFDVSLKIEKGEVVVLLGRNGAGKSTTFRSIIGLTTTKAGEIIFNGKKISGLRPYQIARLGIGFVPEDRRVFADLTVKENLEVAQKKGIGSNPAWSVEKIYEIFPRLAEREKHKGSELSGGEQQMLTIGRSLMGNPDLILLDEPSEGLAPMIVKNLAEFIVKVRKEGVTVLLAEQNINFSLKVSDRGYIIDKGTIKYEGTVKDLIENQEIKDKYLAV